MYSMMTIEKDIFELMNIYIIYSLFTSLALEK